MKLLIQVSSGIEGLLLLLCEVDKVMSHGPWLDKIEGELWQIYPALQLPHDSKHGYINQQQALEKLNLLPSLISAQIAALPLGNLRPSKNSQIVKRDLLNPLSSAAPKISLKPTA